MMSAGGGPPADLRAAFNQYDLDGDGNITEAEMNSYLSSVMQQYARHGTIDSAQVERRAREAAAKMFREADANGDGRISFEHFVGNAAANFAAGIAERFAGRTTP